MSAQAPPSFRLVDVTRAAGITFTHNNGAFGKKFLPETLGAGAAFLDYNNDGRQDILLVNGSAWPGQPPAHTFSRLYRNEGGGRFTDVTKAAGLQHRAVRHGRGRRRLQQRRLQDVLITAVGQNRLFRNTGKGTFVDVTDAAGLGKRQGFSTSALWFDYDRDGWLDLLVCNYVKWTPDSDVFCSVDGKQKSYCTPEAYRGTTSWLFRNRRDGTFEDVTAKAGLFDATSKSLGVTLLDYDLDVWPDLFVANDTQPNKLYRNNGNGTFTELGLQAGLAFSEEGRARAGMGVDAADVDNTGRTSVVVTNFSGEMLGLYRPVGGGQYSDVSPRSDIGRATRHTLGFGCFFFDADLDGLQDLLVVNGHIDDTISKVQARVTYAEAPHLFRNVGRRTVRGRRGCHGRHVRAAEGGPRRRVRRLRRRRRSGRRHHQQRRTRVPVSQRRAERQPRDPAHAAGHEVEPRCDRRQGARHGGRAALLEDGQDRIQLPVAVGAAALLRPGHARRPPTGWRSSGRAAGVRN